MASVSPANTATLAVMPFANLSARQDLGYFTRGLEEELIVDLSQFSTLQVISSYTSARMADPDVDMIEAAGKIEIDYLLKGSVRVQRDLLCLTSQLLETASRRVIWAENIKAPLDDLFDIQDNIVERVVYTISAEVNRNLLKEARKKPVTSLAAYDCWLRGMDRLRSGTLEADREARDFFHQALALDPYYGRAYAGLSLSHFNEWSCQLWELYERSERSAYTYAVKAFQLDESDHLVQMILGRVYLYRRQFDQAEYHITRSLELNGNDADSLVQLASCLAFLGRAAEGERLFDKALRLNPYRNLWYYQYGSLAAFVQRKYRESIDMALKRQLVNVWVDLPGFLAAAYAHLGERHKAAHYVSLFIDSYITSISRGRKPAPEEILDWVLQANPFKYKEDADCLSAGLIGAGLSAALADRGALPPAPTPIRQDSLPCIFKQEQAIWRFEFGGIELTMPDLKGFHDIARLLAAPDQEVHCAELMGSETSMDEKTFTIDEKARQAYASHLEDLQERIREAEDFNDLGTRSMLQRELQEVTAHLSRSLGLGNRPRKLHSSAERARAAVTLRMRKAIRKIASGHPPLGRHLENSIRTGVFCRYSPEEPHQWLLQ